jgi:hypothetical protein
MRKCSKSWRGETILASIANKITKKPERKKYTLAAFLRGQNWAAATLKFKSPFVPLFQRENFFRESFNPSLEKRGRGDFWTE